MEARTNSIKSHSNFIAAILGHVSTGVMSRSATSMLPATDLAACLALIVRLFRNHIAPRYGVADPFVFDEMRSRKSA